LRGRDTVISNTQYAYPFVHQADCPEQLELPDPFRMTNGSRMASRADWDKKRLYIKEMLHFYQSGKIPPPSAPSCLMFLQP